jgi:hypothetical protein
MTEESYSPGYPRSAAADLLAAVLANPGEVLVEVDLRPGDFQGTHADIAGAVLHCRKVLPSVFGNDLAEAVAERLETAGKLPQGGGAEALFKTLVSEDSPARPDGAATLAGIVRDHAERRRAVEHYERAIKRFEDPAVSLATARRLAAEPVERCDAERLPKPMAAAVLVAKYPTNRPALVDGLLRRGEVGTLVNSSKSGKSWLLHQLALCVASGRDWLGMRVQSGKVLVLDLELHPEVLAFRMRSLAQSMELPDTVLARVDCIAGRGTGVTVRDLAQAAPTLGGYSLVVLDPLYRSFPEGTDENSNTNLTKIFDELDKAAEASGAAWLVSHHATKGGQASKSVADVGAGAGAIARAADLHLVLRQHAVPGVSTLEAVVRSFPPVAPFCVTFDWPQWQVASADLDPTDLAGARPTQGQKSKAASRDAVDDAEAVLAFLNSADGFQNLLPIVAGVSRLGRTMTEKRVKTALERLHQEESIVLGSIKAGANNRRVPAYAVPNKAQQTDGALLPIDAVCSRDKQDEQTARALSLEGGVGLSFCCDEASKTTKKNRPARRRGNHRQTRKRIPERKRAGK